MQTKADTPLILAIDSSGETASVCLSREEQVLAIRINEDQKDHAAWIHTAIQDLFAASGEDLKKIDAVAVSSGPGSYTGIRVGMSTAKGICFALDKPLITIGTLEMMARAARGFTTGLICPLIDARRMEVFYALYDSNLKEIEAPAAKILQHDSFSAYLREHQIVFTGSGAKKLKEITGPANNALFPNISYDCSHLLTSAVLLFRKNKFADLAYFDPLYVKEFYMKK